MSASAIVPDVRGRLAPAEVDAVRALVARATAADGVGPLSEHVMLHLPRGGDAAGRNLLVHEDGELVGYAHLDITDAVEGSSAELVVDPDARKRGIARALVSSLLANSPDGRLRLWAHGEHPAAAVLAASLGFERSRVLWQMRRPLSGSAAPPLPAPQLPPGVSVRTFRPGADEAAWLALNNRAFAWHPDQGGWTAEDLELRKQEPWFDPDGFFLAERATEAGPALVGFHWTKIHGASEPDDAPHDHPPLGEVYVVGVDPREQGRGLGPALTLVGLHWLADRGLDEVLLYVEGDNAPAIAVYERLGFARTATDVLFSRSR